MINEQLCTCPVEEGQTVIVKWRDNEDGSREAICCKCNKPIGYRSTLHKIMSTPRIQGLSQDPAAKKDHMIILDLSLFGSAAVSCQECGTLTWWRGPKESLEEMCHEALDENELICPRCRKASQIDPEWLVMFQ